MGSIFHFCKVIFFFFWLCAVGSAGRGAGRKNKNSTENRFDSLVGHGKSLQAKHPHLFLFAKEQLIGAWIKRRHFVIASSNGGGGIVERNDETNTSGVSIRKPNSFHD